MLTIGKIIVGEDGGARILDREDRADSADDGPGKRLLSFVRERSQAFALAYP
jgi:hypothetical protein